MHSRHSPQVTKVKAIDIFNARLQAVEDQLSINQTIARYCRALDWLDESLLRTCYTNDADIDYGFYKGDVSGFYPVVMQIERATLHRSHFLSNVAIQLRDDFAEVECYGIATSTFDNAVLNVFGGRYLNRFQRVDGDWLICKSNYILDYCYVTDMPPLGEEMEQLQTGIGLDFSHPLYRALYTAPSNSNVLS